MTSYMDYIKKYIYNSEEDIDNMIIYTSIPLLLMIYYYFNMDMLPLSRIKFIAKTYGVHFVVSTVMMVAIYVFVFNMITRILRMYIEDYNVTVRIRIWLCQMIIIGYISYMFIIKSKKLTLSKHVNFFS